MDNATDVPVEGLLARRKSRRMVAHSNQLMGNISESKKANSMRAKVKVKRSITQLDAGFRGEVKHGTVTDLKDTLLKHDIDFSNAAARDNADQQARRRSWLIRELFVELNKGHVALVAETRDEDETLTLQTHEIRINLMYAGMILIITHERCGQNTAKMVATTPTYMRVMNAPLQHGVESWLRAAFGIDTTGTIQITNVKDIGDSSSVPSPKYPGMTLIHKTLAVEATILESAFHIMPSLGLPGGLPVMIQKELQEGEPIYQLCAWWPLHFWPTSSSCSPRPREHINNDPNKEFIITALQRALFMDYTADPTEHVHAVLRISPNRDSMLFLVDPPDRLGCKEELIVVHIVAKVDSGQIQELTSNYNKLRAAAPGNVMRLIKAVAHDDMAPPITVQYLAIDGAGFAVSEYATAMPKSMAMVVLDDVAEHVINVVAGSKSSLSEWGGSGADNECNGLVPDLAKRFTDLISMLSGTGSIEAQLMSSSRRSRIDITEAYNLAKTIMQHATKRMPGIHGQEKHNMFSFTMREVVSHITPPNENFEDVDIVSEALNVLRKVETRCRRLDDSRKWRRDNWRPLSCVSHGHLSFSNVLVDTLGSMQLYNFAKVGEQPVLCDVANLSLSLFLDCCRLPISADQLLVIITEADWITSAEVSQWLQVHPAVAEKLMEHIKKELAVDVEVEEDEGLDGLKSSNKRERASALMRMNSTSSVSSKASGVVSSARKHLKILEVAADAEPVKPKSAVFKSLERVIVCGEFEMLEPFDEACRLAEAWVQHLEVLAVPASMPPNLSGSRLRAWELQILLLSGSSLSYSQVLKRMSKLKGQDSKIYPIDTSPLLLELPALDRAVQLLSEPGVPPWQKLWICHLIVPLGTRILQHLAVLDTSESTFGMLSSIPTSCDSIPRVKFAPGHRLLLLPDLRTEKRGLGTDGTPVLIAKDLPSFGATLPPDDPVLNSDRALIGWPCSALGLGIEEVLQIRASRGLSGHHPDPRVVSDEAMRTQMCKSEPALLELRLWPRPHAATTCISMCFQVTEVAPDELSGDLVVIKDVGSELLLKEVVLEDLFVQDRCVGWASVGEVQIRPCPYQSFHAQSQQMMPQDIYLRFPCTSCGKQIQLTTDENDYTYAVHCDSCWSNQVHFNLCRECMELRTPLCPLQHSMACLDNSPYVGQPTCNRCQKTIDPMPRWDCPSRQDLETVDQPRWFHCRLCAEKDDRFDLCIDCGVLKCPKGHPMNRVTHTNSTLLGPCKHCGQSGGLLNVLQCMKCQEIRCEVVYPNVESAKEDIALAKSTNRSGGLQVLTVKRNGAASLAGIEPGHRILSVNGRPVRNSPEFAFVGVKSAVTVEFAGPVCEVRYEDSGSIQKDLIFERNAGALIVLKTVYGGAAAKSGVAKGARLVSVNSASIETLNWNGAELFDVATCMGPPYVMIFRPRGSEMVVHSTCGVMCEQGHFMEAQCPQFIKCAKGHPLQPFSLERLDLTRDDYCTSCHMPLLECGPQVMWCSTCEDNRAKRNPRQAKTGFCDIVLQAKNARAKKFASTDGGRLERDESTTHTVQEESLVDVVKAPSMRSTPSSARENFRRASTGSILGGETSFDNGHTDRGTSNAIKPRLSFDKLRQAATRAVSLRSKKGLCLSCAGLVAMTLNEKVPYQGEGTVQCAVCARDDLGCPQPGSDDDDEENISFFHCGNCPRMGQRFDVCVGCMGEFLLCPAQHPLKRYDSTPYLTSLSCATCGKDLSSDGDTYNCSDCWSQDGRQTDRCKKCVEQHVVEIGMDTDAQFQLLSREAPHMNVSWLRPGWPVARTRVAGCSLLIRLELRGFVYPPFARLRILDSERNQYRDGTIRGLPLANGKYEVILDDETKAVMFEPDLANHIPAGVWRYRAGQELSLFTDHGWIDVRVRSVDAQGNGHVVEPESTKFSIDNTKKVTLNTWNHAPLWLRSDAFCLQQRLWNDRIAGYYCSARDPISGHDVDVMQLLFNVQDYNRKGNGLPDKEGSGVKNLWPWVLHFADSAHERNKGIYDACGLLIMGEESSGKTQLVRRMVVEAMKSHLGEMVPLPLDGLELVERLVETMGDPEECLSMLSRPAFLSNYLALAYGDGSKTGIFLQQALHARRVLILVDGIDKMPKEFRGPFLCQLGRLVDLGHRVLVVARPDVLDGIARPDVLDGTAADGMDDISVPPVFRLVRLVGLDEAQRKWFVEERLGDDAKKETRFGDDPVQDQLQKLHKYEADVPGLFDTALMFELCVRVSEGDEANGESDFERTLTRATAVSFDVDGADLQESTVKISDLLSKVVDAVCSGSSLAKGTEGNLADDLQVLATHVFTRSGKTFGERDLKAVTRERPKFEHLWKELDIFIRQGRFSLITCLDTINRKGQKISTYRFAHRFLLHYLCSLEIVSRWGKSTCPLTSLEYGLSTESWTPLIPFLSDQLPGPIRLRFAEVDRHVVETIAHFMTRSRKVQYLCLAGSRFGVEFHAVSCLCDAISLDTALNKLDVSGCALGSEGVGPMCMALKNHPALKELSFKENNLGHLGAQHVGDLIYENHVLQKLDLSQNTIGDIGAEAITNALAHNDTLQELGLASNDMSKAVHKRLDAVVTATSIYRVVDTRYNRDVPEKLSSPTAALVQMSKQKTMQAAQSTPRR